MGLSPQHARTVSLVLNLDTGCVSPAFHLQYDDFFETVRPGNATPKPTWMDKAHFTMTDGTDTPPSEGGENTENARRNLNGLQLGTANSNSNSNNSNLDYSADQDDSDTRARDDIFNDIDGSNEDVLPPSEGVESPEQPNEALDPPDADVEHAIGSTIAERVRSRGRQAPFQRHIETAQPAIVAYEALFVEDYSFQEEMDDPIAYLATTNKDTMCMHEALQAPDAPNFMKAMQDEVSSHEERGHWKKWAASDLPKDTKVLDSVWSMKRKRRQQFGKVCKYKSRLNIHGGQQEYGVNYWDTHSPVVSWPSIRLFLTFALLHNWHTKSIDWILAYPHADVECDLYMKMPPGFEDDGKHVLKIVKNIYGQKQAGRVFNQFVDEALQDLKFKPSEHDPCVYYKRNMVLMLYVDNCMIIAKYPRDVQKLIRDLEAKDHKIDDEGDLDEFLGVQCDRFEDGRIKLSQPYLIQQIIDDVKFKPNTKTLEKPGKQTLELQPDLDKDPFDENYFKYRSVIGKLNYLEKSTRPDITVSTHMAARFSSNPRVTHGHATKAIVRYLMGAKTKGIIMEPKNHSFDVYADASFTPYWNKEIAEDNKTTARSRHGFIVRYANCPVTWASRMQTEFALSATEAEYYGLSDALRTTIPLMQIIEEAGNYGLTPKGTKPKIHCKLFEDNSGAVEMVKVPKIRPRTRHINTKYHHFRSYYDLKKITIHWVATADQIADHLSKNQSKELFFKHRNIIMNWDGEEAEGAKSSSKGVRFATNSNSEGV